MTTLAFEESATFNRKGRVGDVAFNARRSGKLNLPAPDRPEHAAADGDGIGDNFAFDRRFFANDESARSDVAIDLTVELNFTVRLKRADDQQVGA